MHTPRDRHGKITHKPEDVPCGGFDPDLPCYPALRLHLMKESLCVAKLMQISRAADKVKNTLLPSLVCSLQAADATLHSKKAVLVIATIDTRNGLRVFIKEGD